MRARFRQRCVCCAAFHIHERAKWRRLSWAESSHLILDVSPSKSAEQTAFTCCCSGGPQFLPATDEFHPGRAAEEEFAHLRFRRRRNAATSTPSVAKRETPLHWLANHAPQVSRTHTIGRRSRYAEFALFGNFLSFRWTEECFVPRNYNYSGLNFVRKFIGWRRAL